MDQPSLGQHIIGCDWGTSSVRLALLRSSDQQILSSIVRKEGVSIVSSNWRKSQVITLQKYFFQRLQSLILELQQASGFSLEKIQVCISGMASSSIGIKELAYAEIPFGLSGSDVVSEYLNIDGLRSALLISGVRSEHEVMRGEEIQILGIKEHLEGFDECTVLLPGTHSKHVKISGGQMTEIRTFMTGELFSLLSEHSVLKHSVQSNTHEDDAMPGKSFLEGLQQSGILSNLLFGVRIGSLFGKRDATMSRDYLLGLLIGHELRSLENGKQIVLCASNPTLSYYSTALKELFPNRTLILDERIANEAAFKGQAVVFKLKS